ncbi:hypothetical protein GALMADRAFT_252650 [Galerina marginata CBS 339.88]|uniref:Ribosomal protein S15 n=1 Tax=Galerina marginata (strain CBS 339.88) TaxID=685588 RepID=A0A067SR82_GALM3|nr:hypothetical protein GALMADRAFT_252650 [Galerina marginata CBS 339.88]
MFRGCLSSGSRAVASTSQNPAFFHTSSILNSQASRRKGLRTKKINVARTEQRSKEAAANQPSVVLGTRPSEEETKWKNCYLSKVLVNEEELFSTTEMNPVKYDYGTVNLPKQFGFGVDEEEQKMLFYDLPVATGHMAVNNAKIMNAAERSPQQSSTVAVKDMPTEMQYDMERRKEVRKANLLAKALDLRNANAAGIAFENRRRIVLAFSTPEKPFDSGRTEVQVALLTYKIRNLWTHLLNFKRDVGNRRALRKLIHDRAKLLRYLKGQDRDRYETVLEQLALEPEAVEGELVV